MDTLLSTFQKLPPLGKHKDPTLAAIIGFFTGGIGLGIYFLSFLDFVLLMVIGFILLGAIQNVGWLLGACFASVYGYFRAKTSNDMLDK